MWLEHRMSALLQLHIHSRLNTWLQWIGQTQLQDEMSYIKVLWFGVAYIRGLMATKTHRNRVHTSWDAPVGIISVVNDSSWTFNILTSLQLYAPINVFSKNFGIQPEWVGPRLFQEQ